MKRAAIYARISVAERKKEDPNAPKVEAVKDQEKRCRILAQQQGYEVVAVFADEGISAYSGKTRPQWLALNDAMKRGAFDVVLAVAEDRLARNSEEKIGFQSECSRQGVTWHTIAGGAVDPSTAGGGLMATITGGIAQFESQLKSERVRASVQRRLEQGQDLGGRRAFGWEKGNHEIREHEAELVRMAHQMLLDGGTVYAITQAFQDSGIKPTSGKAWRTSTVRVILHRARNCGRLEYKGDLIAENVFPAIVSVEEHEQVRAILADPSRRPKTGPKKSRLLSGVLRCIVCGEVMGLTKDSAGFRYRCQKSFDERTRGKVHPSVRADDIETRVRHEVISAFMSGSSALWGTPDTSELASLDAQLIKLAKEKSDLLSLVGDDTGVTMADIRSQLQEVAQRRSEVDARREEVMASSAKAAMLAGARAAMVDPETHVVDMDVAGDVWGQLSERFDSLDIETKQTLIRDLIDIEVGFGRGPQKVTITHKVVTSLNEEEFVA